MYAYMSDPTITEISAEELKKVLDAKEKVVLLDVRTPNEFKRTRIEGSINIPIDEISLHVESVIPDKKQKIYVYCLSGSRSSAACHELVEKGYTNVFNLTSGVLAWLVHQYPMV